MHVWAFWLWAAGKIVAGEWKKCEMFCPSPPFDSLFGSLGPRLPRAEKRTHRRNCSVPGFIFFPLRFLCPLTPDVAAVRVAHYELFDFRKLPEDVDIPRRTDRRLASQHHQTSAPAALCGDGPPPLQPRPPLCPERGEPLHG